MTVASKYAIQQTDGEVKAIRSVQIGTFNGNAIEVVTAYSGTEDRYAVHAYITAADGVRRKLPMHDNLVDGEREGFAKGWGAVDDFFST